MKNIITAAIFASGLLFTVAANAQKKEHKTPEEKATHQTEHLTKKLALNADQQAKVKQITLKEAEKMHTFHSSHKGEMMKADNHEEMKAIREERHTEIKAILTPDQAKKYDSMLLEKGKQNKKGEDGDGKKGKKKW